MPTEGITISGQKRTFWMSTYWWLFVVGGVVALYAAYNVVKEIQSELKSRKSQKSDSDEGIHW